MVGPSQLFFNLARWKMGTKALCNWSLTARRQELTLLVRTLLGNKVIAGPFKGMVLPDAKGWGGGDGDFIPKLLGTYEADLHEVLLKAVARKPSVAINVGCAEGYYAVGLARLLPNAQVYAFDSDSRARTICVRAAEENGESKVTVRGACAPEHISEILERPGHALLVVDCEGAELELLDSAKIRSLARCDIVVETHDFIDPRISSTLERRFGDSHEMQRIDQGGRNPNEAEELRKLDESDRWLLVNEGRPESMTWFACWAK